MLKTGVWLISCCLLGISALAEDYTEQEAHAAWDRWKRQPVTESNFRAICDLVQDIAKNHIDISYEILSEYVPMVRKTGNKAWLHILLMSWARAKESLTNFQEADSLFRLARDNAAGDPRRYDEALVGTVLLYAEWGRIDSLDKYVVIGREAAAKTGDKENLSFLYTFGAMAHLNDTAAMGQSLTTAMDLAGDLPDRNALFTARYNYASIYCRNSPQRQVAVLESLLDLAKDSTLTHKPRLYERTAFSFRNPTPNIYLQLMQVNLLLADYENAGKFAELLYDAVVKPNPSAPQAPFFNTELALVKAYQGQYVEASEYLEKSQALFNVPEEKIPYPSYFLAAGMLEEHRGQYEAALRNYQKAYKMGSMEGLHLMPSELYYAHGLIQVHRLAEAEKVLATLQPALAVRTWSAYGYYYYRHYADLLKEKRDYAGYAKALEMFYAIKDSLASLNHYRAIQEIEAKVRLRDKEQQIVRLNEESAIRIRNNRRERIYFIVFVGLAVLSVLLLIAYARKQRRIGVMRGAIDAEQRERHKIADQLHEEVGGMLSLATLNLTSALERGPADTRSEEKLQKTHEILGSVSTTIREISHRLTPLVIEKYGFRRAVEDMAQAINLSQKIQLQTVIIGFEGAKEYPIAFLNDLYRMLQELLQNIVKHAGASRGLLELVEHEDMVSILVEDDGVGMPDGEGAKGVSKGKGLDTIRSKIAYLDGRIEISRKADKGTLIVIELNTNGLANHYS